MGDTHSISRYLSPRY